jgi:hypothetical protein
MLRVKDKKALKKPEVLVNYDDNLSNQPFNQ